MLTKENLVDITTKVFEHNGIDINDKQSIDTMDSLEYISILVGLEQEFDIEFPDSMLVRNMFEDMDGFYELLSFLLGDKCE